MILIENELAFVSIPKCASVSIHNALENSDFKIEPTFNQDLELSLMDGDHPIKKLKMPNLIVRSFEDTKKVKIHLHLTISEIYTYLKTNVNTLTIKRDFSKRFVSTFYYIFDWWIQQHYKLQYIPNKITNDFIYEYFTNDVVGMIKQMIAYQKTEVYDKEIKKLLIEPLIKDYCYNNNKQEIIENNLYDDTYVNFRIFDSQEAWKTGYKPTYVFEINEMDKVENFLMNKFDKKIKIGKDNSIDHTNSPINIVNDQRLRDWVWKNFEKEHFIKKIF
jgi:hypothetical protein